MTEQTVVSVSNLSKLSCSNYLLANRYLFSDFIHHDFSSSRHKSLRKEEKLILDSISFSVRAGEKIGITGYSAEGQSLLGKILAGLITPTKGSFSVRGRCVYVAKPSAGFKSFLSILENAKLRLAAWGATSQAISRLIPQVLKTANLIEQASKLMINCSDEEVRSLAYALLIVYDADIYILDDFFPWLKTTDSLAQQLQTLIANKTVFFIGEADQLSSLVDKVLILENGKLIHQGVLTAEICKYLENRPVETKARTYLQETEEELFIETDLDSSEEKAKIPSAALQIGQIRINQQVFDYHVTCLLALANQKTTFDITIKALENTQIEQVYLQIHSRFNPIPFTREPIFNPTVPLTLEKGAVHQLHFEMQFPAMHRGVYGLALEVKLKGLFFPDQNLHKIARFGILAANILGDGLMTPVQNAKYIRI